MIDAEKINYIVSYIRNNCCVQSSQQAKEIVDEIYDNLIMPFVQKREDQKVKDNSFTQTQLNPTMQKKVDSANDIYNQNLQKGLNSLNKKC